MKMYKVSEVAKILHINRNEVYNLINSGKLKAAKIGSLKISETWLNEFIENSIVAA